MNAIEIATSICSVLMLASRFVEACKPVWDRLPKSVQVVLPVCLMLASQVMPIIQATKTWSDLVTYLGASVALVIIGLFPKKAQPAQ